MDNFTETESEKLVGLISQCPALYNYNNEAYKDINLKDNIWKEIAKELNRSSDTCKKHWKNIRDGYVRYKRRNNLRNGSALPNKSRSKWQFYQHLRFLDVVPHQLAGDVTDDPLNDSSQEDNLQNIGQENDQICNEEEPQPEDNYGTDVDNSPKVSKKIMKRRRLNKQSGLIKYFQKRDQSRQLLLESLLPQNNDDDLGSFANHIKTVLKKLPPVCQINAKKDIFEILTKYEIMAMGASSRSSLNSASESSPLRSCSEDSRGFDAKSPIGEQMNLKMEQIYLPNPST